jgi:eukaryotic-like serine/threonine-protein kinase
MREKLRKSFWLNLLVIILLSFLLYILFFASLKWITHHGEEVKIPNMMGKSMNVALAQLRTMHFEVYIDSAYDPKVKPLMVLKQVPDTGSIVKTGRTVFLTVNRATPLMTPMPNLVNLSFRSAEMLLRNNKLLVGDTTFKPDIAAGAVLKQMYNGNEIRPGDMIAQGSKVDLVIGDGLGITQFNVPDVVRMNYDEASGVIVGNNLQCSPPLALDDITDTGSAIVVEESPAPVNEAGLPNRIKAGDIIDLKICQHCNVDSFIQSKRPGAQTPDSTNPQKPPK